MVGEFRGCRRYPALTELPALPGGAEGTSPRRPAGSHSQNPLTAPELRLPAASYRPPSLRLGFRRPLPHPVPGRSSSEPFPVKTPPRPVTGPRTRRSLQAACRPLTGSRSHPALSWPTAAPDTPSRGALGRSPLRGPGRGPVTRAPHTTYSCQVCWPFPSLHQPRGGSRAQLSHSFHVLSLHVAYITVSSPFIKLSSNHHIWATPWIAA